MLGSQNTSSTLSFVLCEQQTLTLFCFTPCYRRYVQILDCAKYLTQQSSEMDTNKNMVSILSNHKINSPEISIRVKQVLVNAQQEGMIPLKSSTVPKFPGFAGSCFCCYPSWFLSYLRVSRCFVVRRQGFSRRVARTCKQRHERMTFHCFPLKFPP